MVKKVSVEFDHDYGINLTATHYVLRVWYMLGLATPPLPPQPQMDQLSFYMKPSVEFFALETAKCCRLTNMYTLGLHFV